MSVRELFLNELNKTYLMKKNELAALEIKAAKDLEEKERARLKGDLSENAEYTAAKEECHRNDYEKKDKTDWILSYEEFVGSTVNSKYISIGSIVLIDYAGKERIIQILPEELGTTELDGLPVTYEGNQYIIGTTTKSAPIGKSIFGKQEGNIVEVVTPRRSQQLVIKKIIKEEA